jgi:small-conductance mechanosensitive channel
MIYIKVFVIAIALFLIMRLVSFYIPVLTGKRKIRKALLKVFPVLQLLVWVAYAFWAFDQLFHRMAVYPILTGSLIVLMVALIGWYFLRDFVSGIILKAENAFEAGQQIQTTEVSGTLKKLGYRTMEITNSEGEHISIPYSLLTGQKIVKPAETGNWTEQLIMLKIPSAYPPEKIQSMLKIRILEMPWIVTDSQIKMVISRDETGNYIAKIYLHLLSPENAMKTDENLQVFVREMFA